jgi:hypothetical protein
MRWTSDDFDGGTMNSDIAIPDYPADIEVMGYFSDPLIAAEIDEMITDAELMGIDLDDPELMGAFLKNIVGKIRGAVQRRKASKKTGAKTSIPQVSISTGAGTAQIGPGGLTWSDPQTGASIQSAGIMPTAKTGGISEMLKNPLVLAGIGGGVLLLIMAMKKRG